jgi:ABC-type lipoprotein export system ATPase subunit/GNAT superfamily N-acetyltransferase
MPSSKFIKKITVPHSFRNEKVKGMFDVNKNEIIKNFDVNIPIENIKWNVGAIIGASGTGKTTIAKEVFKDYKLFNGFEWDNTKTVIDNFDVKFTPKQITEILSKVGFSSPPDWLKPFNVLSNGQKMRVELARLILENNEPVIYDEFTSVVDREVAKVGSYAIQKYVRKENKQFIAVSCHYDILEWLEPDWIYDVNTNEFKKELLWQRPKIEVKIRKAEQSEWKIFKEFHYLSSEHNTAAHKYIAEINNKIVGWISLLHFPHPKAKNIKRIHRLVILPDYQGIGVGTKLLNEVSRIYKENGFRILLTTSSPALVFGLQKQKEWVMTRAPSRISSKQAAKSIMKKTISVNRLTASFEYKG